MAETGTRRRTRRNPAPPERGAAGVAPARRSGSRREAPTKLTKESITRSIADELDVSPADVSRMWSCLLAKVREALLVEGGSVVLTNIGTLTTYTRRPRSFQLPFSGETVEHSGVLAVRFQSSRNLREQLREIA